MRDSLIGVRFVDGTGAITKNGGRVMKNVTGYDLVKLMCGSHGTLGILTEMSFKVLPMPRKTATLTLNGLDDKRAVEALSMALGSPFDITGAAHFAQSGDTIIRIEGFADSVAYRCNELTRLLAPLARLKSTMTRRSTSTWQSVRDCTEFAGVRAVWRISLKPSDGLKLLPISARKCHSKPSMIGVAVWSGFGCRRR
ncbi:MAG: hypothetical protein R3D29_04915 [Nitratireductor sp.]